MTTTLRPLSIGELLDRSFSLYRQQFVVFITLAAVPALFVFAGQLLFGKFLSGIFNNIMAGQSVGPMSIAVMLPILLGGILVFSVVFLFSTAVAQGALIKTASAASLGQSTSISQALAAMKGKIARTAGVLFVTGLITSVGFVFLIVPGIILALRWALVIPSTVLEGTDISQSWSRSTFLTEDARGRIFLIGFLYFVVLYSVATVIQVPIMAAFFASMIKNGTSAPTIPFWYLAANYGSNFVVGSLVTPILMIALTLQYYDGRIRKEAFDLQLLIDNASAAAVGSSGA